MHSWYKVYVIFLCYKDSVIFVTNNEAFTKQINVVLNKKYNTFIFTNEVDRWILPRNIFDRSSATTTIRTTRAWVEICVSHSRRSIDLWLQKRVRYSCFEKCTSPMIDTFEAFNACDLRGLLDREYPHTCSVRPLLFPACPIYY